MTDLDILTLGCVVSFVAAAGSYVYLRQRFLEGQRVRPVRVRARRPQRRRAA